MNDKRKVTQVNKLVDRIFPLLENTSTEILGGVLAKLLASWLAGFRTKTPENTEEYRIAMLSALIVTVAQMIDAYDEHDKQKLH